MSKRLKKKRNKPYRGADASTTGPSVRRYSAVERSKLGQWWYEHKKSTKIIAIIAAVIALISWFIVEAFRLVF